MKSFEIPAFYRSELLSTIKNARKSADKLKKDFSPTKLSLGSLNFYLARHFGFCYGVENAIEIAFKAVNDHPAKKIYLLSEMIHNPQVNQDLQSHGIDFIMDTYGNQLIPWDAINKEDIIIIPAFGTTIETLDRLKQIGIATVEYNTTCPFVEKVWKRGSQIGQKGYTIIIHGKPSHEETRATFSQSAQHGPCVVINDMSEAKLLADFIKKEKEAETFFELFKDRYSEGFDPAKDFEKIGVINQTTMLAEDTQAIADYLKAEILDFQNNIDSDAFADTRDTLCYATNDNQSAVKGLLEVKADVAFVVGGYNSSNTSHLVELCEEKLPTYYIKDETEIISKTEIHHFDFHGNSMKHSLDYMPEKDSLHILVTAGASCPDAVVEKVIAKIAELHGATFNALDLANQFQ